MKKVVFIPSYPAINNAQLLKDCGMVSYFCIKTIIPIHILLIELKEYLTSYMLLDEYKAYYSEQIQKML